MAILTGIEMLRIAARRLGPLKERVVFVGGATLNLLFTESTSEPRVTEDVDVIVEAISMVEYQSLEAELRKLGFENDMGSRVICRYRFGELILDFMPTDPGILGFSNHWYKAAFENAVEVTIAPDLTIKVVTAPYFLATKFEAFESPTRVNGNDYLASRDFSDIVSILDGRHEVVAEIRVSPNDLRDYLAGKMAKHLPDEHSIEPIAAHLPPDSAGDVRGRAVWERMQAIAALG